MGKCRHCPAYKKIFRPPLKALLGCRETQTSAMDQLTLLSHVLVQHQFAMPEEIQYGPEVGGVTVNEVGPGLILWRRWPQEVRGVQASRSQDPLLP